MSYDRDHAVHFADLDGDGRAEYLFVGADGDVHGFYNQGNSAGKESTTAATPGWWDAGVIADGVGGVRSEIRFAVSGTCHLSLAVACLGSFLFCCLDPNPAPNSSQLSANSFFQNYSADTLSRTSTETGVRNI